jgi:hypothetical protein
MRNFADHMSYRRCGELNRLTLSFRIGQPAPVGVAQRTSEA